MHLRKRLDRKGFCAGLAGIFMVILVFQIYGGAWDSYYLGHGLHDRMPHATNIQLEPATTELTMIRVYEDGRIVIESDYYWQKIDDLALLPGKVKTEISKMRKKHSGVKWSKMEENKVLLMADGDLRFGKIAEIFKVLNDAGIKTVGLITQKSPKGYKYCIF